MPNVLSEQYHLAIYVIRNPAYRYPVKKYQLAIALLSIMSGLTLAQPTDSLTSDPLGPENPVQNIALSNADRSWRPTSSQRQEIERLTLAYFSAKDANRYEDAYRYLDSRQQQSLSRDVFEQMTAELNQTAGKVIGTSLRAVTWYKDTPQAGPGLYVAVDYSRSRERLALNCGYIVLHEQPDNSFLILREEMNVIDKQMMEKISPAAFEEIQRQFKCK